MTKDYTQYIMDVPDFPQEGVLFRDITSLLKEPDALKEAVDDMARQAQAYGAEAIAGMESRGFLFGVPVAYVLGLPFIPIRKAGKLPRPTYAQAYDLEYGQATLEIHQDDLAAGTKVVLIDDLIATGGTAAAAARLVEKTGAEVAGFVFLLELINLEGRQAIAGYPMVSLASYGQAADD